LHQEITSTFQLEIVSAEREIFSGPAKKLFVTAIAGEMEVLDKHAPLLTTLEPGPVWVQNEKDEEEAFVIFGGFLEVQPHITTVLADSAVRGVDIDEQAALSAKQNAESLMHRQGGEKVDYQMVHKQLVEALAQLRVIRRLRGL